MESGFTILRKRSVAYIRSLFQRFRFVTVNREIMVFLLFLIVAVAFWLSQTFKDHTTVNLEYELKIVNVPKNLIFTSDVPSTIAVAVSGRGFTILQYVMNKQHKVLSVDYNDLPKMGGTLSIDNYVWKKGGTEHHPSYGFFRLSGSGCFGQGLCLRKSRRASFLQGDHQLCTQSRRKYQAPGSQGRRYPVYHRNPRPAES